MTNNTGLRACAGTYTTDTKWWNDYFSPLIIANDGLSIELAGTTLYLDRDSFSYDADTATITFPPIEIGRTEARCEGITFSIGSGPKTFAGTINPRPQDGPVPFSGSEITSLTGSYEARRRGLRKEFFQPFISKALSDVIGWSPEDEQANAHITSLRQAVISQPDYYDDPYEAAWFADVRDKIEATELFGALKSMPKGAILHIHPGAMGDYAGLLDDAAAYSDGGKRFFVADALRAHPEPWNMFSLAASAPSGYSPLADRLASDRQAVVDTLVMTSGDADYEGDLWDVFQPIFQRVGTLFKAPTLQQAYYDRAFTYLATEDNVSHIELRTWWDDRIQDDEHGNPKPLDPFVTCVLDAVKGPDGADQITMKAIYSEPRSVDTRKTDAERQQGITNSLVAVGEMMRDTPGSRVVGYDLFGEEDRGRKTVFFLKAILDGFDKLEGWLPPMYFHDGESPLPPYYGEPTADAHSQTPAESGFNNNMVDAYMMNTLALPGFEQTVARVGHGLELFKTPGLSDRFQEAGLCIELCPISNQMLGYVGDIREHPGQNYLAAGIPVTLNPDDPAIYGYQGVTHDFWEACVAWNLDLFALKVLAYNSLQYSALNTTEKADAIADWQERWDVWIAELLTSQ